LYGANIAFEKTKSARQVLVLEGYFDVIQAHQEGFEFAVGTLGTALTKEQARLLYQSNLQRRVVLGFDNDDAGFRALKSSLAVFQEASFGQRCDLRVFDLHETKDIDDLLKSEDGPKKVAELLDSSPEAFSHVIQKYYEQCDVTEAISREHYVNEAVEIVAKVYDPIQRELLAELCAEKFSFTKETIIDLLNKRKVPTKTIFKETKSSSKGSITNILEYLILALLSFSDDLKVQKEISEINFQTEELNLMKHELLGLSLGERERVLSEITVIQKQINIIKTRLEKGENFETIFKECIEQLTKVNSNSPKKFTALWKKKEMQLGIKPIN
jgi:DNA primase